MDLVDRCPLGFLGRTECFETPTFTPNRILRRSESARLRAWTHGARQRPVPDSSLRAQSGGLSPDLAQGRLKTVAEISMVEYGGVPTMFIRFYGHSRSHAIHESTMMISGDCTFNHRRSPSHSAFRLATPVSPVRRGRPRLQFQAPGSISSQAQGLVTESR